MTDFILVGRQLNSCERAFLEAVVNGNTFKPSAEYERPYVRALVLHALLTGQIGRIGQTEAGNHQIVAPTPFGIRIDWVTRRTRTSPDRAPEAWLEIRDRLDLADLSGPNGAPLPPIELFGCRFTNMIDISGARLSRLSLRDCHFEALNGAGVRVDGRVDLRRCGPLRPAAGEEGADQCDRFPFAGRTFKAARQGQPNIGGLTPIPKNQCRYLDETSLRKSCVVNFGSAHIGGTLELSFSDFCRMQKQRNPFGTGKSDLRWAVNLGHARIGDSVEIVQSAILGSINFSNCTIGADLRLLASRVIAFGPDEHHSRGHNALDMRLATIGGLFSAEKIGADRRNRKDFAHCLVIGGIEGIGIKAREIWLGGGLFAECSKYRDGDTIHSGKRAIELPKARIEQSLTLGNYSARRGHSTVIIGHVYLNAVDIGKNFEVNGVGTGGMVAGASILPADADFQATAPSERGTSSQESTDIPHEEHTAAEPPPPRQEPEADTDPSAGQERKPSALTPQALIGSDDRAVTFLVDFLGRHEFLDYHLQVKAHAAKIGRRVQFSNTYFANPEYCSKGKDFYERAAVDFWKSRIGTGFLMGPRCAAHGGVLLNRCEIGREVVIRARLIATDAIPEPPSIPVGISLSGSMVDGDVRIGSHTEADLHRTWTAQKNENRAELLSPAGSQTEAEPSTFVGALLLAAADIRGSFVLSKAKFDLSPFDFGSNRPQDEWDRTVIGLPDAKIGQQMVIDLLPWRMGSSGYGPVDVGRGVVPPDPWRKIIHPYSVYQAPYIVDLTGLRAGSLIDDFGRGWQLRDQPIQLLLAGINFERVEPISRLGAKSAKIGASRRGSRRRIDWLGHQFVPALTGVARRFAPLARARSVKRDTFVPQTYDEFATRHIQAGEQQIGYDLIVERKDNQTALTVRRLLREPLGDSPVLPMVLFLIAIVYSLSHLLQSSLFGNAEISPLGLIALLALLLISLAALITLFARKHWNSNALLRWLLTHGSSLIVGLIIITAGYAAGHLLVHGDFATPSTALWRVILFLILFITIELAGVFAFRLGERAIDHAASSSRLVKSEKVLLRLFLILLIGLVVFCILKWLFDLRSTTTPITVAGLYILAGTLAITLAIVGFFFLYLLGALLFREAFRYGLDPLRGLFAIALLLTLGSIAVQYGRTGALNPKADWATIKETNSLDERIAIVLDVQYQPDTHIDGERIGHRSRARAIYASPSPCDLGVNSVLYAADVFIPLIDLDQRKRCRIRDTESPGQDRYLIWRWGKTIYELLGWVVISLMILTVSGLTRRDIER